MKNLTSPTWILIKGVLFLILGLRAGALLVIQRPTLYVGFLLITAVWAFCRFYYFTFYVNRALRRFQLSQCRALVLRPIFNPTRTTAAINAIPEIFH
jgi:hypothetical protein